MAAQSVVISGVQIHSSAPLLLGRQKVEVQPHIPRLWLRWPAGEFSYSVLYYLAVMQWSCSCILSYYLKTEALKREWFSPVGVVPIGRMTLRIWRGLHSSPLPIIVTLWPLHLKLIRISAWLLAFPILPAVVCNAWSHPWSWECDELLVVSTRESCSWVMEGQE